MLAIGAVVSPTKHHGVGQPYRVEEYLVVRNAEAEWPFKEAQFSPKRQEAFAASWRSGLLGEIFVLLVPTRADLAEKDAEGMRILPLSAIIENLDKEPGWVVATTSLGELCQTPTYS